MAGAGVGAIVAGAVVETVGLGAGAIFTEVFCDTALLESSPSSSSSISSSSYSNFRMTFAPSLIFFTVSFIGCCAVAF